MNIIFDVHIANPNLPDEVTPEENLVLNEIYLFVQERVELLRDEIEGEEAINPKHPPAIIIYLRSNAIQPRDYSANLSDKILKCFSENDAAFIARRIDAALGGLLN